MGFVPSLQLTFSWLLSTLRFPPLNCGCHCGVEENRKGSYVRTMQPKIWTLRGQALFIVGLSWQQLTSTGLVYFNWTPPGNNVPLLPGVWTRKPHLWNLSFMLRPSVHWKADQVRILRKGMNNTNVYCFLLAPGMRAKGSRGRIGGREIWSMSNSWALGNPHFLRIPIPVVLTTPSRDEVFLQWISVAGLAGTGTFSTVGLMSALSPPWLGCLRAGTGSSPSFHTSFSPFLSLPPVFPSLSV